MNELTLVDHNTINKSLRYSNESSLVVTEIADHHMDENMYLNRGISHLNESGHALVVASTTTLVAERLFPRPYSASIGTLLTRNNTARLG